MIINSLDSSTTLTRCRSQEGTKSRHTQVLRQLLQHEFALSGTRTALLFTRLAAMLQNKMHVFVGRYTVGCPIE